MTNKRRNWKSTQPRSLRHALELCKDYALEVKRLSVARIAERMGMADHFNLYKWLQTGRMPAVLIPAYEHACGINYVTRWFASSNGKLLIDMPIGRSASAEDMQLLQTLLHDATGALLDFYAGRSDAPEALASIQAGLEGLAWHRENVSQHHNPQLDLETT